MCGRDIGYEWGDTLAAARFRILQHRSAPDDDDRRRVGLTLTAKGGKALDAIRRRRNDWLAARLAALSGEERAALAAAAAPLARLAEDR